MKPVIRATFAARRLRACMLLVREWYSWGVEGGKLLRTAKVQQ